MASLKLRAVALVLIACFAIQTAQAVSTGEQGACLLAAGLAASMTVRRIGRPGPLRRALGPSEGRLGTPDVSDGF